jgi:hypothetical protein
VLKQNEKSDRGISNSTIPFFGTPSSVLQRGKEETPEKEKKID